MTSSRGVEPERSARSTHVVLPSPRDDAGAAWARRAAGSRYVRLKPGEAEREAQRELQLLDHGVVAMSLHDEVERGDDPPEARRLVVGVQRRVLRAHERTPKRAVGQRDAEPVVRGTRFPRRAAD